MSHDFRRWRYESEAINWPRVVALAVGGAAGITIAVLLLFTLYQAELGGYRIRPPSPAPAPRLNQADDRSRQWRLADRPAPDPKQLEASEARVLSRGMLAYEPEAER